MGVASDAHSWWEKSQMRFLVLSSLVLQFLLLFIPLLRRYAMPGWMRFVMSLAFLGGDALAIFALATLYDRHKADQGRGGSSTLEVLWAPVLLAHLGGLHGVTAWNIEDNERWSGYMFSAVYQVALVIYVFCKSWPRGGDRRLLQAAVLLFVYGCLKCFEKPWAVRRASFTSLVRAQAGERRARQSEGGMSVAEYVEAAKAHCQEHSLRRDDENEGEAQEDEHMTAAISMYLSRLNGEEARAPVEDSVSNRTQHRERRQKILQGEAYKLIADHPSSPYSLRLTIVKFFWGLREARAYDCVREELAGAFLLFYTRLEQMTAGVSDDMEMGSFNCVFSFIRRQLALGLVLPAIGVFHLSNREPYNDIDVKVTYALLCCTAVLDATFTFVVPMILAKGPGADDLKRSTEQWPEKVAQYSLLAYFARNKKHSIWMKIISFLGCKDLLDQHWSMSHRSSAPIITELVLGHLKDGWKKKIQDLSSYRRFNDSRGHWALEGNENLRWSINVEFDESILLWHLATDFCFFFSNQVSLEERYQTTSQQREKVSPTLAKHCREMSNYMVYLLWFNPEMLSPGTRGNLFRTAYDELRDILGDEKTNSLSWSQWRVERLMRRLNTTMSKKSEVVPDDYRPTKYFIQDARALAQQLSALGDEKMWEVIQGVWVEMLCFSASRSRGYLHAKALGSGGEFLSYIWLLRFHMGMETFIDRLQREELTNLEASNNGAPWPSDDAHNGSGTTSSSTSRIRSHAAPASSHLPTGTSTSNSHEIHMANMV